MVKMFLAKHKGFLLWSVLGILSFIVIAGGYIKLTNNNVINVDLPEAYANANGIVYDGTTLVAVSDYPRIMLPGSDNVNYIDINITDMTENYLNACLYYSDDPNNFQEGNLTTFSLSKGSNEIKVDGGKYLALVFYIAGKENVGLILDSITLRSAPKPVYTVIQGGAIFAVIWLLLYFLAKETGIRYTSFGKGLIVIAEGIFVSLMTLILIFALNTVRYEFITYAFIPLAAGVICLIVRHHTFKNKIKLKFFIPVVLILMLYIMCVVGCRMISYLDNDLYIVYNSAWEIVQTGKVSDVYTGVRIQSPFMEGSNASYFLRYQNNLPILFLLSRFYKVLACFGLTAEDTAVIF